KSTMSPDGSAIKTSRFERAYSRTKLLNLKCKPNWNAVREDPAFGIQGRIIGKIQWYFNVSMIVNHFDCKYSQVIPEVGISLVPPSTIQKFGLAAITLEILANIMAKVSPDTPKLFFTGISNL